MTGLDGEDEGLMISEDEEPNQGVHSGVAMTALPRGGGNRKEREKKEKAQAAVKHPKQSKQLAKVLKKIEEKKQIIRTCEEEIST
jgi:hypothetical protein